MTFEWDRRKARTNKDKHGIDFSDATLVFEDPRAISMDDDHPDGDRRVVLGMDALGRILVVVYSWREDRIRVISARAATKAERQAYGSTT